MTNIMKLMQAAKKMQADVAATQKKLEQTEIIGENEYLSVITNGQHLCKQVIIHKDINTMNKTQLEQYIVDAINQTHEQIKTISKSEFSQLAEDMAANETDEAKD